MLTWLKSMMGSSGSASVLESSSLEGESNIIVDSAYATGAKAAAVFVIPSLKIKRFVRRGLPSGLCISVGIFSPASSCYKQIKVPRQMMIRCQGVAMTGIQYVTDQKGKRVAVQLDLRLRADLLQEIEDILASESRQEEERIPLEQVEAKRIQRGKLSA
jgi:hypothetical protein